MTTAIEHSAVLRAAERVAERGAEVTFVAPRANGLIDPEEIRRALRPATRLISVMLANNETGVLQPVEEIGRIAAEAGAFFHIDAVQGAGKVEFDVRRFGCHLCSISAHKMHGLFRGGPSGRTRRQKLGSSILTETMGAPASCWL